VLPSLRDYETGQFPLALALQATVRNSPIKAIGSRSIAAQGAT
jgi:hypothetical protein